MSLGTEGRLGAAFGYPGHFALTPFEWSKGLLYYNSTY